MNSIPLNRISVIGGLGFIGTNITLEALKRGYEVVVFDSLIRKDSEENISIIKNAGAELCRGDVREPQDFQRMPIPDAIINLAGNPGIPWSINWPKYDFDVNAKGALNVLEYARIMGGQIGKKIPVIQASTNKVYPDSVNDIPLREKATRYEYDGVYEYGIPENFGIDGLGVYAHSPYGVSKLTADMYMQEYYLKYEVPTVVNRMSCIYGLHQKGVEDQGWVDHFVRTIGFRDGKLNIYGNGKQVRDMLFGSDVARLYIDELENIEKVKGQVFNIGGGVENTMSLNEAIDFIEFFTDKKAELNYLPWRHADQRCYISDIRKVERVLGWKPQVSPKEGIKLMIERYARQS